MAKITKKKDTILRPVKEIPNLYERMKNTLRRDPSVINVLNKSHETLLMRVLKSKHSSLKIVKLLIKYDVNVNLENASGHTPLLFALYHRRDLRIIQTLLEAGAYPWRKQCSCNVPKCIICKGFEMKAALYTFELISRKNINDPRLHFSAWICVLNISSEWAQETFFRVLLEKEFDINTTNVHGQSVLCVALQIQNLDPYRIQLLLSSGASLEACYSHSSSLHCVTSQRHVLELPLKNKLRKEVVKILLDAGSCPNQVDLEGCTPLQCALRQTEYDFEAIKLLLDQPGVDMRTAGKDANTSLLCDAVLNSDCSVGVAKLLMDRGAQVNDLDKYGNTPLHLAAKYCSPSVVQFLLDKGAPVNAKNTNGTTPLSLALANGRHSSVLNMLIAAGASIALVEDTHRHEIVSSLLSSYHVNKCEETIASFKRLTKYFFLLPTDTDIKPFYDVYSDCSVFSNFGEECLSELWKMGLTNVPYCCTLRDFVCGYPSAETDAAEFRLQLKMSVFNHLMKMRPDQLFPTFVRVILALVGRPVMIAKLEEVLIYNSQECPDLPFKVKTVVLNRETACHIASYLSDEDLLRLMLAYYH